jgi:hypothetical protein
MRGVDPTGGADLGLHAGLVGKYRTEPKLV